MIHRANCFIAFLAGLLIFLMPHQGTASTAQEIIDKAIKGHAGEAFRAVLQIETFQAGKKISEHALWVVGQSDEDRSALFLDFTEPEDSKGVRLLFRMKHNEKPEGFMFLPATGQTMPVDIDDPTTEIAGTGLTVADMQPLFPKKGEQQVLDKEEDVAGRPCYVIRISVPGAKEDRFVWISKDQLDVVKFQQMGPDGKTAREMRVVEFFKTEKGRMLPREEEISVPGKGIRIKVRQEHGVYGITVPEELMDPQTFGTFKWRIQ